MTCIQHMTCINFGMSMCTQAHLQAFYLNLLPPNHVGAGWTFFCAAVALAEPTIGVMLDKFRAVGVKPTTVLRTCRA
jgi:hypothetical protein